MQRMESTRGLEQGSISAPHPHLTPSFHHLPTPFTVPSHHDASLSSAAAASASSSLSSAPTPALTAHYSPSAHDANAASSPSSAAQPSFKRHALPSIASSSSAADAPVTSRIPSHAEILASLPSPSQPPAPIVPWKSKLIHYASLSFDVFNDWIGRPFCNGLFFGLGTHLALYSYQRMFQHKPPTLPYIHGIQPQHIEAATDLPPNGVLVVEHTDPPPPIRIEYLPLPPLVDSVATEHG